jgi:hypothetical protein
MSIERRFNDESYRWEAQILERGDLSAAYGAFVTRAQAIAWAEAERKAMGR